ncbi:carbohydrate porin [Methylobacterium organophilum]|uniref:Porin n=1 Tax=Methylobacterium organophilum TaxID=410 RepID=A0ABQ4T9B8_METOR|nr:carbohydrate porin [Methylobacterium organophilum]GJE27913.1 hypothetical protein LKMONMHP_2775 [Methylobacterium organophilum]
MIPHIPRLAPAWSPLALLACLLGGTPVQAQIAAPIADLLDTTQPETNPRIAQRGEDPVRTGPLAAWATDLAAHGLSFDVNAYDFYSANPTLGLRPGQQANAAYLVLSMSADLQRLAGIEGGTLNFTQSFFGFVRNLNIANAIGDSTSGFLAPYNPNASRLSLLTYQQRLLDDRLVLEIGRTHPDRYYVLPPCGTVNSCYQDLLVLNAGWTSSLYGVWGGNAAYQLSPSTYVQAGAFSVNPNTNWLNGYEWGSEWIAGAVVMTEMGLKTDYAVDPYPRRFSLTGFVNTADHDDSVRTVAGFMKNFWPGTPTPQKSGTSGLVLTASRTIWRADGGREAGDLHPTALTLYASAGYAFDATIPVRFNGFVGLLLAGPDRSRPEDTYGIKFNWQRLNDSYAIFLGDTNFFADGTGQPYPRNKFVIEANAHFELGQGVAVEPVLQYVVNANSFYEPYTARRARDGVYLGASLVVPIGTMLGLAAE